MIFFRDVHYVHTVSLHTRGGKKDGLKKVTVENRLKVCCYTDRVKKHGLLFRINILCLHVIVALKLF